VWSLLDEPQRRPKIIPKCIVQLNARPNKHDGVESQTSRVIRWRALARPLDNVIHHSPDNKETLEHKENKLPPCGSASLQRGGFGNRTRFSLLTEPRREKTDNLSVTGAATQPPSEHLVLTHPCYVSSLYLSYELVRSRQGFYNCACRRHLAGDDSDYTAHFQCSLSLSREASSPAAAEGHVPSQQSPALTPANWLIVRGRKSINRREEQNRVRLEIRTQKLIAC
jgi:hypothetical protein